MIDSIPHYLIKNIKRKWDIKNEKIYYGHPSYYPVIIHRIF
jgi:tRNA A22 N-methylase